jgi:hypothetical protein
MAYDQTDPHSLPASPEDRGILFPEKLQNTSFNDSLDSAIVLLSGTAHTPPKPPYGDLRIGHEKSKYFKCAHVKPYFFS